MSGLDGLPAAADRVPARYCAWLLRPLLDLGPFEAGPIYAQGVEHAWLAWTDPARPRFALQRTLAPGFRAQLLDEAGRSVDEAEHPQALPAHRRTARWQALCDALDGWAGLGEEARCRLVMLLHALCLHECVDALVPPARDLHGATPAAAELAYWAASSRYMLRMPARFEDYRGADLAEFEAIAAQAAPAVTANFNACCKLFTHAAKTGAQAGPLAAAGARMAASLDRGASVLDPFSAGLLRSRFHRAWAFLPMCQGDRAGVRREMDEAERLARALRPCGAAEELLALENLHPLMESRSKEALWAGDGDLALAHAREVVALDPHDPKSRVELGQLLAQRQDWSGAADAFVAATMLGPPTGAIARHLAGNALQHAGQPVLAAFFLQAALQADALALSPRAALAVQQAAGVPASLKDWSGRRFEGSP